MSMECGFPWEEKGRKQGLELWDDAYSPGLMAGQAGVRDRETDQSKDGPSTKVPVHTAGTHFRSLSPVRSRWSSSTIILCPPDRVPVLCQVQGMCGVRAALFGAELIL